MRGCSDELRSSECERSSEQEHLQNSHIVPSGSVVPSPGPTTLSELAAADVALRDWQKPVLSVRF